MDAKIVVALVGIGIGVLMKVADGSLKDKGLWGTLGTVFILAGVVILAVLIIGEFGIQFRSPVFVTSSTGSPVTLGWWVWLVGGVLVVTLALRFSTPKKWWVNRLPASSVATTLPPSIETSREGGNVSLALSQIVADSTVIDTEKSPSGVTSVVVFVVEESRVSRTEGENYPLKLWLMWANHGDDIHIGRPRWETIRANISPQQFMYRFTSSRRGTDSEEADVKHGQRGKLWFALDPKMSIEQAELLNRSRLLGVLTLPITVGTTMREIQIQL